MTETREPISRQIIRNTVFNALGRVWLIGINFLLTPLLLSYLGQDRFGVWVLFWVVTSYLLLCDLGLGTAPVKYFSEHRAKGDAQAINAVVTGMLCVYLLLGGLLLVILWPAMGVVASLFNISRDLVPEAVPTFRIGLVVLMLLNLVNVFDAMLKGFQRMDLTNLTLITVSAPNLLGSYGVLLLGGGLRELALVAGSVYLFQLVLLILLARRVFPALRVGPQYLRLGTLMALFGYGARLQVFRLADLVTYQVDKLLLGLFAPLRYVTFYDLGAKVSSLIRDMPYVTLTAAFPAASELASLDDRDRLWLMYQRGTKYLYLLTVPMLVGTWLTAHLILQVWLGHVSSDVRLAVFLLSAGYWSIVGVGMVTTVGAGIGWLNPLVRASLIQGALNLLLSLAGVLLFGYAGVLAGTATALIVSNGYLLVRFCRDFNRSVGEHFALLARVVLINLPSIALTLAYLLWGPGAPAGSERGPAFLVLLGGVGLYAMAYLVTIRLSGILDRLDGELLGDLLPALKAIVRAV